MTCPPHDPQTKAAAADRALAAAKAALRSRLLDRRADLPAEARAAASATICRRLRTLPELRDARAVLAYAAFGSEVDLDPALRELLARGAGVFLPRVEGDELAIARVHELDSDLAPGWRGVREPRGTGQRPARVDRVDVVLVPGVAFDRSGRRLGYGGGHFDRLLARLRPGTPAVGIAFAAQVVDAVPCGPHDRPVDVVVTEEGVLRPRPDHGT